jgi:hypothetical protein
MTLAARLLASFFDDHERSISERHIVPAVDRAALERRMHVDTPAALQKTSRSPPESA